MFNLFRLCRKDEISFDIVAETGNIVAKNGNNVEATFDIVERIYLNGSQLQNRSTVLVGHCCWCGRGLLFICVIGRHALVTLQGAPRTVVYITHRSTTLHPSRLGHAYCILLQRIANSSLEIDRLVVVTSLAGKTDDADWWTVSSLCSTSVNLTNIAPCYLNDYLTSCRDDTIRYDTVD